MNEKLDLDTAKVLIAEYKKTKNKEDCNGNEFWNRIGYDTSCVV